MVTVTVINYPPKSPGEFEGVGARLLFRSLSFSGDTVVAHSTVWIRKEENDPPAEAEVRMSIPVLLEQTLGEVLEMAKDMISRALGLGSPDQTRS